MDKLPLSNMRRWLKGQMLNRMYGMLTCLEFEEFIQDYLNGELTQKQQLMFTLHLRVCRECREYLASYQRTMDISQVVLGEPYEPVPHAVPSDLIQAILESKSQ